MERRGLLIVVHGGAGDLAPDREAAALAGVAGAAERGFHLLAAGRSALDAVVEAVAVLEDDPAFNAGTGSVLNRDGEVEMDAGVMEGATLRAGGVAAIRRVRNPVRVARLVMERTPHLLLAGEGALRFARERGVEEAELVTPGQREAWELAGGSRSGGETVGAVALDGAGVVAAATSTGGLRMKLPGRVGDSPIPGAGNYANGACAVSATGRGEQMLRMVTAKALCDRVAAGEALNRAANRVLAEIGERFGRAEAGLIAVTTRGEMTALHATPSMVHAFLSSAHPVASARVRGEPLRR